MAIDPSPAAFKAAFVKRTGLIREAAGFKQDEMADALGVNRLSYPKYETRTPLPHRLIPRFCRLTGADPWLLFTGERHSPPTRLDPDLGRRLAAR